MKRTGLAATLATMICLELTSAHTMDESIARASNTETAFDMIGDTKGRLVRTELDMMLTPEQYGALYGKQSWSRTSRNKRKATRLADRWTNKRIPYRIERYSFSSRDISEINQAIEEWEENTCITFRPATSTDINFVYFQDGKGCQSNIGMIKGKQAIDLAKDCRYKGIIAHEIGHAVGFFHEQNRPDRDDYVTILKHNILDSRLYSNFDKYSLKAVSSYGIPYDYLSIMHYGGTAFSGNGQYTIKTKDPSYQERIGNRDGLSFRDIKLANLMYNCSETCNPSIVCPGEGFVGKDCRCWCPGNPIRKCDGTESLITTKSPALRTTRYTNRPVVSPTSGTCIDINSRCPAWSRAGYCQFNLYVRTYCKNSCSLCGQRQIYRPTCVDVREHCNDWKKLGYCYGMYSAFMREKCPVSCDFCPAMSN